MFPTTLLSLDGRAISGLKGETMSALNLSRKDITAYDGTPVRLVYDQEADILEIFFGVNEPATGVDLTDHIVLRLNQQTKRAISLMLLDFSILTERTEYGPRSYPLDTLNDLPEDLRELVLQLITSMPVGQFLKVSHLQVSPTERVPLTYVESQPSVPAARHYQ
jgi:hypothetical protein